MNVIFKDIGEAASEVLHGVVVGAKAVQGAVAKVASSAAPGIIEGITAVIYPPAVTYERLAFAVLGPIAALAADTENAAAQEFLNANLDVKLVADLKALWPEIEAAVKSSGVTIANATKAA